MPEKTDFHFKLKIKLRKKLKIAAGQII